MLEGVISYHAFNSQICGDRIFLNPYSLELLYYLTAEKCPTRKWIDTLKFVSNPATRALGELPTAVVQQTGDGQHSLQNLSGRELATALGEASKIFKKCSIEDGAYFSLASGMMKAINFILFTDELLYGRFTRNVYISSMVFPTGHIEAYSRQCKIQARNDFVGVSAAIWSLKADLECLSTRLGVDDFFSNGQQPNQLDIRVWSVLSVLFSIPCPQDSILSQVFSSVGPQPVNYCRRMDNFARKSQPSGNVPWDSKFHLSSADNSRYGDNDINSATSNSKSGMRPDESEDHKMLWDRLPSSMFEHFAFSLAPVRRPSPAEVEKSDTVAPTWAVMSFGTAICLSTIGFFVAQPELRDAFSRRFQLIARAVEAANA